MRGGTQMHRAQMHRTTRRTLTALAVLVTGVSLVGAACTPPPGPAPTNWKVRPVSITVHDGEDNDAGDEPYVIQVGFRSKLGVANSSSAQIASQCYSGTIPGPDAAPDGTTVTIPAGAADITFPTVQNLDLGDVLFGTAPLEIFGTLTFAVERDAIFGGCAVSDLLQSALVPTLTDALNLLIAASPVPPTQEQLVQLIVDNLGNFLNAIGSFIGAIIEGLGNPDDIIGVGVQVLLPTAGAFTELLNTAFAIAGFFAPGLADGFIPLDGLPSSVRIRVGPLAPSVTTLRFQSDVADYALVSSVV